MKKIFSLSLMSVLMFSLTSCLKDKTANIDPEGSPAVVGWSTTTTGDIPSDVSAGFTRYVRSYEISNTEIDMPLQVSYSGSAAPTSDVTVTLGLNLDAITAYNEEHETENVVLPTAAYTMPTSVVIKAGQRKADVIIKLRTDRFDLSEAYMLPVAITATTSGNVSSNFGTVLYSVGAKNKWDGAYTVTGTMTDALSAANVGSYPREMHLVTQSATTDALFDPALNGGSFFHYFLAGTSGSYYGNTCPVFTFNADDVVTSAVNLYGQGTNSQVRAIKLGTGAANKWTIRPNADNQTMEVQYIMTQGGSNRVTWTEKWVRKGPRP